MVLYFLLPALGYSRNGKPCLSKSQTQVLLVRRSK